MNTPATLAETRDAVVSGARSAVDVCREALARIDAADPSLHAFHTVTAERALARAAEIDANRARFRERAARRRPGWRSKTTSARTASARRPRRACSKRSCRRTTRPSSRVFDAAGAVLVGKTNCDEFAMGSSTENSAFGPSHNPWAPDRIPGGSSGGSAVAVAAGMTPLSLGSDTGGSIRQPAAMCGVFGLKPTYGRVSRYGLLAFGSSLDQIGPLTRTRRDAAHRAWRHRRADPADSTASRRPVPDYTAALTGEIRGMRIGVPCDAYSKKGVDPEIRRRSEPRSTRCERAAPRSSTSSCRTRSTPSRSTTWSRRRRRARIWPATTASATACGIRRVSWARCIRATREKGFGAEVKRRIMLGTYVLSAGYYDAYYLKAQQVRTLILRDYDAGVRARRRRRDADESDRRRSSSASATSDPLQMYLADIFTVSANLAGLPAVSVPCGFTPRLDCRSDCSSPGRAFDEAHALPDGRRLRT